ncbi:alanine racemase [Effusibacillus lacus]|uniref:Alanine racemase n=1 Tax=Effusibacillus lacus TaxID=1348429 RepID=A0A292YHJ7_9BACL|nr:alanine racemase [Effusibacillus lacus]TCS69433.1 alanine racemase [Effusibacillus lacus]GAX89198.1 alanine racemase [Effusibacillus lacus]
MIRPTWAEIDLGHIAHNLREFRRILPEQTRIMAVVKADGYGHGAVPVAKQAIAAGAAFLGVATLEEAIELRKAGIDEPILVLGYVPPSAAREILRWNVRQTCFHMEMVEALAQEAVVAGTTARIHVKVDTGMGRLGLQAEEAADFVQAAGRLKGIEVEGVYSHFATADELDKAYAERQAARWKEFLSALGNRGIPVPLRHIANSAAAMELPDMAYDMVRIGISMYGLYPSQEVDRSRVNLRQALRLVTRIVHLKTLPRGAGVSYGAAKVEREQAVIATLPIGYADGFSRRLSGKAHVLVRGQRVPIIGRICMDQCMADVTDVEGVSVGDEVVLYGGQGESFISLDEIADLVGSISYEVVCGLGKRVTRKYVGV